MLNKTKRLLKKAYFQRILLLSFYFIFGFSFFGFALNFNSQPFVSSAQAAVSYDYHFWTYRIDSSGRNIWQDLGDIKDWAIQHGFPGTVNYFRALGMVRFDQSIFFVTDDNQIWKYFTRSGEWKSGGSVESWACSVGNCQVKTIKAVGFDRNNAAYIVTDDNHFWRYYIQPSSSSTSGTYGHTSSYPGINYLQSNPDYESYKGSSGYSSSFTTVTQGSDPNNPPEPNLSGYTCTYKGSYCYKDENGIWNCRFIWECMPEGSFTKTTGDVEHIWTDLGSVAEWAQRHRNSQLTSIKALGFTSYGSQWFVTDDDHQWEYWNGTWNDGGSISSWSQRAGNSQIKSLEAFDFNKISGSDKVYIIEKRSKEIPSTLIIENFSANPSSGTVPLNDVDLTVSVGGTAAGSIRYYFDCTNDGQWDFISDWISDNPYTKYDVCDYNTEGNYTVKAMVEREGLSAEDTIVINVSKETPGESSVSVSKTARNITTGQDWSNQINASPGNEIEFRLEVSCTGSLPATDVEVWDILPEGLIYVDGSTKIDDVSVGNNDLIEDRLSIGDLDAGESKEITFKATVDSSETFYQETTSLINKGYVRANNASSVKNTSKIVVSKKAPVFGVVYLNKLGRNVSRNQTNFVQEITASLGEIIEFSIQIIAFNDSVSDITVFDQLPSSLTYINGSTSVNGQSVNDGITTVNGLNIGSLNANESKTIKFRAKVVSASQNLQFNSAFASGNNGQTTSGGSTKIIIGPTTGNPVKPPTGPFNTYLLSALIAVVITGIIYVIVRRKELFKFFKKEQKNNQQ